MAGEEIGRRVFLKIGLTTMVAIGAIKSSAAAGQQPVPNSSGTEHPKLKAPANAADCHMHIYDPARFPMPPSPRVAPDNAALPQYRLLQQENRYDPSGHRDSTQLRNPDNEATITAIREIGRNARGIAVVHPRISRTGN